MKRFILNILIFFGIVAVLDMAVGMVFKRLQSKAGGGTGAEYYVCKQGNEDILVMGSSRASHHYVSKILTDSLGLTCYNGGQDGNGIVMQYGRWKMIAKRHVPKVIIYDIVPTFDLSVDDKLRYVDRLKPYADDKDVCGYIAGLYPLEKLKLKSKMYCFNYKFLEVLSDCVRPNESNGGYKPNRKHIRQEMIEFAPKGGVTKYDNYDEVKLKCLESLISEATEKGTKVILVSSPYWRGYHDMDLSIVRKLAERTGIPFIDYADSEIRNNPNWWADRMHLNDDGAQVFTSDLAVKLRLFL